MQMIVIAVYLANPAPAGIFFVLDCVTMVVIYVNYVGTSVEEYCGNIACVLNKESLLDTPPKTCICAH